MSTNYTPQTWRNEGEPGDDTPIDKERLAHIEAGLAAHDHENGVAFGTDEPAPYRFSVSDAVAVEESWYHDAVAVVHTLLTFTATATGPLTLPAPPNNGSAQLDFILFETETLPDPGSSTNSASDIFFVDAYSTPSYDRVRDGGFLFAGQSYTLVIVDWSGDDIATVAARPPIDVTPAMRALEPFGVDIHVPPAAGTSGVIVSGPGLPARLAAVSDVLPLIPGAPFYIGNPSLVLGYTIGFTSLTAGVNANTVHVDVENLGLETPGKTVDVIPGYLQLYNYDPDSPATGYTGVRVLKSVFVQAQVSLSIEGLPALAGQVHEFNISAMGLSTVPLLAKADQNGIFHIGTVPIWFSIPPGDYGTSMDLGVTLTLPDLTVIGGGVSWNVHPTT